jgi:2-oxoglutarate dehydrogenase E2 component (dihydrolipoamide succinyltransferase)
MTDIVIPALGESVTEASIVRWVKSKGDFVNLDDPLLELETDKVTLEINAPASGILSTISFEVDDTVEVGQVVGKISISGDNSAGSSITNIDNSSINNSSSVESTNNTTPETIASPSASKILREGGVDPSSVEGSGKSGRITKNDAVNHISKSSHINDNASKATASNVDLNTTNISNVSSEKRVKMSRLRQRIAERLKEAQNTAAILTTFNEIDMTNVMSLRSRVKSIFEKKHGAKLGFMSFFVKACVLALQEIPEVNAEVSGNDIVYKNHYDIGVAVGTKSGLVVPVVRGVDSMSFADIENEIQNLAIKARDGKLSISDLTGGTFTISNGGVYGSLLSTPIINPPQSAILGMHNINKRPMVVDGKIEIRPMMYLALSYDHRIIDGKGAVSFLIRVKETLEDPERMLLQI